MFEAVHLSVAKGPDTVEHADLRQSVSMRFTGLAGRYRIVFCAALVCPTG